MNKHGAIIIGLLAVGLIALLVFAKQAGGGASSAPGTVTAQDVANATTLNLQATQQADALVQSNLATAAAYLSQHDTNQYALDTTIANNATTLQNNKLNAQTSEDLATIQAANSVNLANISAAATESVASSAAASANTLGLEQLQLGTIQSNNALAQTQVQAGAATNIAGKQQTSNIFSSILSAIPVIGGLFG